MSAPPNDQAQLEGSMRGLSLHGLVAVAWSGFCLACLFVALRCYSRLSESHRLFSDDYWILAALTFLVVNAVLQTLQAPSLYYLVLVSVGRVPAGEALLAQGNEYVRYEFVIIALFWTITWCVKAAFLSLYWRIFEGLPEHRRMWWVVAVFSASAYVGCWIASVWTCHPPSTYFDFGQCMKPIDNEGGIISISYSTAVDILTDFMIMLLPLRILPKLQVNRRQKIGLACVFCVGFIAIAAAIVRLTLIIGQERTDPVGLAVWGLVESSISVIVGSMPALKSLLSRAVDKASRRGSSLSLGGGASAEGGYASHGRAEYLFSKSGARSAAVGLEDVHSPNPSQHSTSPSKEQIAAPEGYSWVKSSESEVETGTYDDEVRIIGLSQQFKRTDVR